MLSLARPCLIFVALLLFGIAFSPHEVKAQAVGAADVLISEFRLSGPDGDSDEYIELYCNRDTNCDISGYFLQAHDPGFGDFADSFPAGTIILARQSLLIGDSAEYSLSSYADLDFDVSAGFDYYLDNQGLQITNAAGTVIVDSVGFIGGGNASSYIEGTGLQPATGARPADQYAYVRKMGTATAGIPQDTNNNANDFVLVSVTGTAHPGITAPPVLGAPGPQSTVSPREANATVPESLVEPNISRSSPPNRVRTGSGNSGTLAIRRTFTNNTGETITYLGFRFIEITTLNSPVVTPTPQAQLRAITSPDAETFVNSQGRTVVIRGAFLEFDPGGPEPAQPNGGGLNSTVAVELLTGLVPGETIDIQFLYNVVQAGNFRVFVNVEVLTEPAVFAPVTVRTRAAATRSVSSTRRLFALNRRVRRQAAPIRRPSPQGVRQTAPPMRRSARP